MKLLAQELLDEMEAGERCTCGSVYASPCRFCRLTPAEAMALAKRKGRSVRDVTGSLNHPCGCSIGRNLNGDLFYGPCPKHGEAT